MAILVFTKQPARVRRIALDLHDEVVFETDPSNLAQQAGRDWRLVLVDDDIAPASADVVERLSRAGQATVVFTREPTLDKTMRAFRAGAHDVLSMPIDTERVLRLMRTGEPTKPDWEKAVLRTPSHEWIGSSVAMMEAFRLASRAAMSTTNVLIIGESGVGKGLLARIIHEQSDRAGSPLISFSCAVVDETLLATELFGTVVGFASGPVSGLLSRAGEGTLFLDHVSELTPALQIRLAAALHARTYHPIGSFESRPLASRVIAASSRELRTRDTNGKFSDELLYEFGTEIVIPPLRRRTEDISVLASYFIDLCARKYDRNLHGIDADALNVLEKYDWPGNVRQLRKVIEHAVAASHGTSIHTHDLPAELTGAREQVQDADVGSVALEAVERRHIRQIWRITGGHLGETAELLGIHRNTLRRKMEQYGITDEDARV